jgi:hypothetical protein
LESGRSKRPTTIVPSHRQTTGEGIKEWGVGTRCRLDLPGDRTLFNVKISTGSIRERQGNSPDEDPGQPKTTEIMADL